MPSVRVTLNFSRANMGPPTNGPSVHATAITAPTPSHVWTYTSWLLSRRRVCFNHPSACYAMNTVLANQFVRQCDRKWLPLLLCQHPAIFQLPGAGVWPIIPWVIKMGILALFPFPNHMSTFIKLKIAYRVQAHFPVSLGPP